MTPEVRQYQKDGVKAVIDAMRRGVRSVVRVLPTGAGKTVEAGMLAQEVKPGSRIGFLVHRRELVRQAWEVLSEVLAPEEVGVESAGWPRTPWARVWVGGVQSLARRLDGIAPPDVLFIDEGHHARAKTWETVLREWPSARLIGLTATPERLDGLGLGQWFAEIILGPSPAELIADGYLAPTRVLRIPPAAALEWRRSNTVGDAVSAYQRYVPGSSALYFGKSIANSREVCDAFRAAGVSAEHVDGGDSDARRDQMVRAFKARDIAVLGNCQLFDEGFDVPGCEVVMVGRYTTSVTRWLQMCGRCMRPGPDKQAAVLDLAGVSWELGLPTDARSWSLADGEVHQRRRATEARGRDEAPGTVPVTMLETELVEAGGGTLSERYMTLKEIMGGLGMSEGFLRNRIATGEFPEPMVRGEGAAPSLWDRSRAQTAITALQNVNALLASQEVAEMLGISRHGLWERVKSGRFPPPDRPGGGNSNPARWTRGSVAGAIEPSPRTSKTPKATRRDLGRAVGEAKRAADPVKALQDLAAELGYKPGWVGHMARIHGLEG